MGCVVSSPQYDESTDFFLFSVDALWLRHIGVIPLDFQEGKHHPAPMAQPFVFALAVVLPNP